MGTREICQCTRSTMGYQTLAGENKECSVIWIIAWLNLSFGSRWIRRALLLYLLFFLYYYFMTFPWSPFCLHAFLSSVCAEGEWESVFSSSFFYLKQLSKSPAFRERRAGRNSRIRLLAGGFGEWRSPPCASPSVWVLLSACHSDVCLCDLPHCWSHVLWSEMSHVKYILSAYFFYYYYLYLGFEFITLEIY